jgi:hypothetical protein
MAEIFFWGSLGLIVYTYFGFPLLLILRGILLGRPIKEAESARN